MAALLVSWTAVGVAAADTARRDGGLVRARAAPELVEHVLRQTGVEREPPRPSFAAYAAHVAERLSRWLGERLSRAADVLRSSGVDPRLVAWTIVALACVTLAWALSRALVGRAPRARTASAVATRLAVPSPTALAAREDWRLELEARLARGDTAAALEALWWWFARSLSGAAVERSWTSRELLARAGRGDLAPLAAALDRLLYGAARPGVEEVRRLAERVQAALA